MLRTCREELAVGLLGDTGLAMPADIREDVAVDGRRGRGLLGDLTLVALTEREIGLSAPRDCLYAGGGDWMVSGG
jgi:hypothetical protein